MTLHLGGDRPTLVYQKPDLVPANYTILNFPVEDIDKAVDELTARGVRFESYDAFEQDEKRHCSRQRAEHRLVQGPGRQPAVRARGAVDRASGIAYRFGSRSGAWFRLAHGFFVWRTSDISG